MKIEVDLPIEDMIQKAVVAAMTTMIQGQTAKELQRLIRDGVAGVVTARIKERQPEIEERTDEWVNQNLENGLEAHLARTISEATADLRRRVLGRDEKK